MCKPCASTHFKLGENRRTSCDRKKHGCTNDEYFTASTDSTADNTCKPCASTHFKIGHNARTSCDRKKNAAGETHKDYYCLLNPRKC